MMSPLDREGATSLLGDEHVRLGSQFAGRVYAFVAAGQTKPKFFVSCSPRGRWVKLEMWTDWAWVG